MDVLEKVWPRIRACLVLAHCVAVFLMALPAPSGHMRPAAWQDPTVQDELAAWTGRLNALGWRGTQPDLEDRLWTLASGYVQSRRAVLRPLRPYARCCGTSQSWRMFVAPHRYPSKLHVDVLVQGEWQNVYVARDAERAWMQRILDSDRMRSAQFRYAWPTNRRSSIQFTDWLAEQAERDFPSATAVRTRWYKSRTPSPEEVKAGTRPAGEFVQARIVRLDR